MGKPLSRNDCLVKEVSFVCEHIFISALRLSVQIAASGLAASPSRVLIRRRAELIKVKGKIFLSVRTDIHTILNAKGTHIFFVSLTLSLLKYVSCCRVCEISDTRSFIYCVLNDRCE